MFLCGTPLAIDQGFDGQARGRTSPRPRSSWQEAGYDGTPVVLMHSTDIGVLTNLAPVAKALLENGSA